MDHALFFVLYLLAVGAGVGGAAVVFELARKWRRS